MSLDFSGQPSPYDEPLATINTTPLVDVMLVLLIIFLITIPVVAQTVTVALPMEHVALRQTEAQNVNIALTRDGALFWNQAPLRDRTELLDRLILLKRHSPGAQLQIHADAELSYAVLEGVILTCRQAGMERLALITQPLLPGH